MPTPLQRLLLLPLLFFLVLPTARGEDEDLQSVLEQWHRALITREVEARVQALSGLIGLADLDVFPELVSEYSRCTAHWREVRDKAFERNYALEHRARVIANLELRAERDASLQEHLEKHREALEKLREEHASAETTRTEEAAWRSELARGLVEFQSAVKPNEVKQLQKSLWALAEDASELDARLGAIEVLGLLGPDGTAVALQKLLADFGSQRRRLAKELPKAEVDVRKAEQRMQRLAEQTGGRQARGQEQEYARISKEAARLRKEMTSVGHLCDAVVVAAAQALSREEAPTRDRSLGALQRAFQKADDEVRLRTLAILAGGPADVVVSNLRELLADEKDAAATADLLDQLAQLGDVSLIDPIREQYLDHQAWVVQAAAVRALTTLRLADAVPLLVERLGSALGRLRTDIRKALTSLTGEDFNINQELWQRWWDQHGDAFVVPDEPPEVDAGSDIQEQMGVTFFGISTTSQRVLFVLDLSGSMGFSMVPRHNPNDERGIPYDMPRDGEPSRLEAARRDLIRALGGLRDGAVFNLVLYASDVWSWQDDCVEMDGKARTALLEYVESLEAVGGTNIYGALRSTFEMIEVEAGDEWTEPVCDTIYLLSDGRASVGVTIDSDEILSYVRDMNRTAGVVIHTIGLSGAHNAYLLRNLAEQNGGTYASR